MIYHLFKYLDSLEITGAGVFQYITFRAAISGITALLFSVLVGKRIIGYLQKQQIGETIRNLGLEGQMQKKGTPTMGGIIILISILVPTLLFADITNTYVILMLLSTAWMGIIGGIDDYIKVFKKNKEGMSPKAKMIGQLVLAILIAIAIDYTHSSHNLPLETNLPITKYRVNFSNLLPGDGNAYLLFIPFIIFIVVALTNSVNLTDGIDGLATGTTAIVGVGMGILAYAAGNAKFAHYLNIIYVPDSGEVVVFLSAVVGACLGFLWYNGYPAQVFMGDTGSLALGGALSAVAIIIKMELLLPVLCGVFFAEGLSVVMQVTYFKYTKRKYGEGRRIFLMSPLHHHYQKKGIPESKITLRFWLITVVLVLVTIALLKLR